MPTPTDILRNFVILRANHFKVDDSWHSTARLNGVITQKTETNYFKETGCTTTFQRDFLVLY
jgi:hypothetical protein